LYELFSHNLLACRDRPWLVRGQIYQNEGVMSVLEKFFAGAFGLIAIYLFIYNGDKTSKVIESFAKGSSGVFSTLQGRG